jgi:hypothetical protein
MADEKITELVEVTTPLVTDMLAVVTGGVTKKVQLANLRKVLEWDQYLVKSADQDVINSVVLVDDTDLQFAMVAGELWYVRLDLIYAASSVATDFRLNFVLPTAQGWCRGQGLSTADAAQAQSLAVAGLAALAADITLGTMAAIGSKRHAIVEFGFLAVASATFKMQFANSTAGVGNTSRSCAGSLMRAKKIV